MRYLIDTSILIAAERGQIDLPDWLSRARAEVITICDAGASEYLAGEPLRDGAKRQRHRDFWDSFVGLLPSVPLTRAVCERAGALRVLARLKGKTVPLGDGLHGAVADLEGLKLLTMDTDHFKPMNIEVVNPLLEQPPTEQAR
jgi:predicted nucleic acid-binding protein